MQTLARNTKTTAISIPTDLYAQLEKEQRERQNCVFCNKQIKCEIKFDLETQGYSVNNNYCCPQRPIVKDIPIAPATFATSVTAADQKIDDLQRQVEELKKLVVEKKNE